MAGVHRPGLPDRFGIPQPFAMRQLQENINREGNATSEAQSPGPSPWKRSRTSSVPPGSPAPLSSPRAATRTADGAGWRWKRCSRRQLQGKATPGHRQPENRCSDRTPNAPARVESSAAKGQRLHLRRAPGQRRAKAPVPQPISRLCRSAAGDAQQKAVIVLVMPPALFSSRASLSNSARIIATVSQMAADWQRAGVSHS